MALGKKGLKMNKEFWYSASIRALRTICQTAIATIGTAMVVTEVDWIYVLSASCLSGILSVLTSIATGLPEVDGAHDTEDDYDEDEEDFDEPVIESDEVSIP